MISDYSFHPIFAPPILHCSPNGHLCISLLTFLFICYYSTLILLPIIIVVSNYCNS